MAPPETALSHFAAVAADAATSTQVGLTLLCSLFECESEFHFYSLHLYLTSADLLARFLSVSMSCL